MSLRRAQSSDVADIAAMMVAFNAFESIAFDPVRGAALLARLVDEPSLGFALVARDDAGAPLGYALVTFGFDLEYGGRDCFLTELFVREDARGGGHGAALLEAAAQEARREGAGAMHLQVRAENATARALYEGRGWRASTRVLMSRALGS